MEFKKKFRWGCREILYPLILYYIIIIMVVWVAGFLFGVEDSVYNLKKTIGALVAIPVLYQCCYRGDRELYKSSRKSLSLGKKLLQGLLALGTMICLGIGVNNLIVLTIPVGSSDNFMQATEVLFGSSLFFQILNSVLVTPILEELLFRGVIYQRLQRLVPELSALILSAAIFGIMHFNMIQFIYAFALGFLLNLIMKQTGNLWPAILGHAGANLVAILRNGYGFLDAVTKRSIWGYLFALLMIALSYILYKGISRINET